MRKSLLYLTSALAVVWGCAATYNLLVAPELRPCGHRYDGFSLLGPSLVGIGVVLFIVARMAAGTVPNELRIRFGRRVKVAGGVLSVVPAVVGIAEAILRHTEGAYSLLLALLFFTGPGLIFFVFGAVVEAIGLRNGRRQSGGHRARS